MLVKMRFLNVLWFHFHHLVPEDLAGQPGTPGSLPRPVPASCQEWPSPRSLLGRCSVPGSVVGTAFTASLGGRHFTPPSAHPLVHPLTPMFTQRVLAACPAPSPGAVRGEGDRGGPGQARDHTPDPHPEAAELPGLRGADRGCRV